MYEFFFFVFIFEGRGGARRTNQHVVNSSLCDVISISFVRSLTFNSGTYSGAIGAICILSSHYLQEKKNADGIGMALHAKSTWKLNGCVAS